MTLLRICKYFGLPCDFFFFILLLFNSLDPDFQVPGWSVTSTCYSLIMIHNTLSITSMIYSSLKIDKFKSVFGELYDFIDPLPYMHSSRCCSPVSSTDSPPHSCKYCHCGCFVGNASCDQQSIKLNDKKQQHFCWFLVLWSQNMSGIPSKSWQPEKILVETR